MSAKKKTKQLTDAQYGTLQDLAWSPETWWHDVPAGTRDVLWREGLIREVRKEGCNTHGHRHPGYVAASAAGIRALGQAADKRGSSPTWHDALTGRGRSKELEADIAASLAGKKRRS